MKLFKAVSIINKLQSLRFIAIGVVLLAAVLTAGTPMTTQHASAATRTRCSATSPSIKKWQGTISYSLANSFCIKDRGGYWFIWQSDGNLVLYSNPGEAVWSSHTMNRGKTFKLQSDGNMVIYNSSNQAVWASSWLRNSSGHGWWRAGLRATGSNYYYIQIVTTNTGNSYLSDGLTGPSIGFRTYWMFGGYGQGRFIVSTYPA